MKAATVNNLQELSTAQLEAMLAERKKAEKIQREAAKKAFEEEKNTLIESLFKEAEELALANARFKNKCHAVMDSQKQKLDQYGAIGSNSKGGFSITHTNGLQKVTRRRDTDPIWDERAHKAVELIKSFLSDTIKKRDLDTYALLLEFIAKDENGDLQYNKVMNLFKHHDRFTDPRWVEGLRLIKESYSKSFKAFAYEFRHKDKTGKWRALSLNFSSL